MRDNGAAGDQVDAGQGPAQVVWRSRGRRRRRLRDPARHRLRAARAQRRRQDDDRRDPRGLSDARRRARSRCSAHDPGDGRPASCATGSASSCRRAASTRDLTVREAIETYGAAYYAERRPTDELLDLVGLGEKADERVATLSGGQQRRLDLALGVVGEPELIFLDEPTTGFDPEARRRSWELIRRLARRGHDDPAHHALPGGGPDSSPTASR